MAQASPPIPPKIILGIKKKLQAIGPAPKKYLGPLPIPPKKFYSPLAMPQPKFFISEN
jgi:hypothetical protein